ncbi:MAG: branched-chain amino acid aminotransferase [Pseudohongiellaceae bacterium]|jgi:branched-chain amino acid aminotransferase
MSSKEWAVCDGQILPAEEVVVSAFDRTLLYGLGAFETVRLYGGRPFMFDRHLARLRRSLTSVGLELPAALETLPEDVHALSVKAGRPSAMCRVTVTAGAAEAMQLPNGQARVLVQLRDVPRRPEGRPLEVGTLPFALDARSPLAGIKSTSYLIHYLLRERAEQAGRVDDLMIDAQGRLTEATVSTVFVVLGGRLLTPPVETGVLPGVTRSVVLELAAELGLSASEESVTEEQLGLVDECFLTGAGKGLWPIDRLAGRELPQERPMGAALGRALAQRVAAICGVTPSSVVF